MSRHHNRIPKSASLNIDLDIQEKVKSESIPFATAAGMGVFCEPPRGAVGFLVLRDVLQNANDEGHSTVEQDTYPVPFDIPWPLPNALAHTCARSASDEASVGCTLETAPLVEPVNPQKSWS
jgi:hypothetical protein